ncbi:hypothetical protein E1301_Tti003547 [Triplophysa tibetana]|uniref:Uncharacterized protein n=1 Tax=Triplophysa tibetana TaxID=1572043 RepID=A0A5A9PT81_9TELE|nr:hypothetical protein E1301_Tti003547 [Triplophysa tibetana]
MLKTHLCIRYVHPFSQRNNSAVQGGTVIAPLTGGVVLLMGPESQMKPTSLKCYLFSPGQANLHLGGECGSEFDPGHLQSLAHAAAQAETCWGMLTQHDSMLHVCRSRRMDLLSAAPAGRISPITNQKTKQPERPRVGQPANSNVPLLFITALRPPPYRREGQ